MALVVLRLIKGMKPYYNNIHNDNDNSITVRNIVIVTWHFTNFTSITIFVLEIRYACYELEIMMYLYKTIYLLII